MFASIASLIVSAAGATDSCTPSYAPGQLHLVDVAVGDQKRSMLLYVPQSRGGQRGPGMVSFHGFHSNPWADVVELMNQTRYAEDYGYSLAIPFGTSWSWPSPICCPLGYNATRCATHKPAEDTFDFLRACNWNVGSATRSMPTVVAMDDVGLSTAAGSVLVEAACVESSRVFALGFSMGSMMVNRIACEAADAFAGVVAISGTRDASLDCRPAKHLSYMSFCGTEDAVCMPMANSTFEFWSQVNNCTGEVVRTYVTETTLCEAYTGCGIAWVERCFLVGMDDQVPGHNRTADFGKMPYQPMTNVDAIDYSFKRFASGTSYKSELAFSAVV